jgi:hypothetical protein
MLVKAAQRLAAQALGRLCNTRFILPETSSKHVALPLVALGQVACSRLLGAFIFLFSLNNIILSMQIIGISIQCFFRI